MSPKHACLGMFLLVLIGTAGGCGKGEDPAYLAEVEAWHAQRLEKLRSNTGWLTLVGLHLLGQGENSLGAAADNDVVMTEGAPAHLGVVRIVGARARFAAATRADVHRFVGGVAEAALFTGGELKTDAEGAPDMLACGTLVFYVIQRGEKFFLRVKDTEAETLRHFVGIERYRTRADWRVEARLEGEPGTVRVTNVLGQAASEASPGVLVFQLAGRDCSLRPTGKPGEDMFVVFGDKTNGHGTYPGGRFLVVAPPDEDGRVFLDFNLAYNPPCVFSPFATCPLPAAENILPVAVTAGEKMWGEGH